MTRRPPKLTDRESEILAALKSGGIVTLETLAARWQLEGNLRDVVIGRIRRKISPAKIVSHKRRGYELKGRLNSGGT